jgi:polyhydroxybutyrate depolymerase
MVRQIAFVLAALLVAGCSSSGGAPVSTDASVASSGPLASVRPTESTPGSAPLPAQATSVDQQTSVAQTTPATPAPSSSTLTTDTSSSVAAVTSTSAGVVDAARPFDVVVPSSYDGTTPMPLVLLLHGYTSTGDAQESYFQIGTLAEQRGFLYVHPNGTTDSRGLGFWNATDACCNFDGSPVDDSAYLAAVIAQVQAQYAVDSQRIFLVGHSNGGFMSYRMACDHADLIAAVVSLAGATFSDPSRCAPSEPVSVLQIHGTDDEVVAYAGGSFFGPTYPSAEQTAASWAAYDGCATTPEQTADRYDVVSTLDGDETTSEHFTDCPAGIAVELRTMQAGTHVPPLSTTFATQVIDFLFAHPKP